MGNSKCLGVFVQPRKHSELDPVPVKESSDEHDRVDL